MKLFIQSLSAFTYKMLIPSSLYKACLHEFSGFSAVLMSKHSVLALALLAISQITTLSIFITIEILLMRYWLILCLSLCKTNGIEHPPYFSGSKLFPVKVNPLLTPWQLNRHWLVNFLVYSPDWNTILYTYIYSIYTVYIYIYIHSVHIYIYIYIYIYTHIYISVFPLPLF